MSIIYTPKGRALEYARLACNLYRGCDHGCKYCYAPGVLRMTSSEFHNSVKPRSNIISKLERCAEGFKDEQHNVLLSFTSDPYQFANEEHGLTRQAIYILKHYGFGVDILSKGGSRAMQDFDLLSPGDNVATTLTFLDDKKSMEWEPSAALPLDRINCLKEAKKAGFGTWASLEPVIDSRESLSVIDESHQYVDLFKVGTLNHMKEAGDTDWEAFGRAVVDKLEALGCSYYIKHDLRIRMDKKV